MAITLLMLLLFYFTGNIIFIHIAVIVIVMSFLFPKVAISLDEAWKLISSVIGRISSSIILSVIFYAVLLPWGLLLKLFGKEVLPLNYRDRTSAFSIRNKTFVNKDLQNPF